MGRYAMIKREFGFLAKEYGFKIYMKQKHGSYYFATWSNSNKNVMVLYDERDDNPVTIRVYDADSFGIDADEYKNEFAIDSKKPKEKLQYASQWLQKAIISKRIEI